MADSNVAITQGSGTDIDTRTEATNGHHRQVVVIGDPSTNAGVAPVDATAGVKVDLGADNDVTISGEADIRRVHNVVDGTISIGNRPDIGRVHNVVDGTISIGNRPDINRVFNVVDGTISLGSVDNTVLDNIDTNTSNTATAVQIMDDWDESDRAKVNLIVGQAGVAANSGVVGATTQRVVHVTDVATSINIVAQGLAFLNSGHTASIFSVSGSSTAAATAGITVIAPSAGYSFKVFAYSIQTTGVLASALTFANGNSAGQTEFWRPLVATGGSGSQSTTPIGANLAVTPPGFIFATGTNTTLVIAGNNGATIHYSVSYIKETA